MEFLRFSCFFEISRSQSFLCNYLTEFNFTMLIFLCFLMRITRLKKNLGPFVILGLFGPFLQLLFFFNFWFFSFMNFLTMTKTLLILCIWKVMSRPLIWPLTIWLFTINRFRDMPVWSFTKIKLIESERGLFKILQCGLYSHYKAFL